MVLMPVSPYQSTRLNRYNAVSPELGSGYAATGIHHACRRRGDVAARGARSVGGKIKGNWATWVRHNRVAWRTRCPIRRTPARLGWTEGRDLIIEYRWAEGRQERAADIAAEFVRLDVDVIFVTGGPGVFLAKKATSVIPIVVALASDPVGTGLVASLARPGGNVTGLSMQSPDLVGKRLDLLRDVAPNLRRLGILYNSASPSNSTELNEVKAAAEKVKLDPRAYEYREAADFPAAFDAMKGQVDAVYMCSNVLITTYRTRVQTLAMAARMPTIYDFRDYVVAGGLMSYGANFPNLFRRSAEIVNKILRGTKASDIPVEQPTKFELVFNFTTAKALGLTISESFLVRADEVIE
jgi:putative tryptophan/tyrosine transport system substrate-binding protein